ncbi:1-(5-phosphoribosyl)-5-[(5-phosphoribosylamino)methylideneamino] imidazole-4-carboxamide isomerase [Haloferax massiliensis]|uniref:1-(5-phosphoribosyl)-5-[(5-phosphoribosylamino)methylideneamino] imidazole-4-carboxamide isomerase n=1 Tax=Haloferax massiliensis TaxID=1476858 RepID=A0A0D6JMK9_9EURY|nr:1-(5-phosphoribosyl)-5-[(5-phosphoribosylamino)methylideneamino] imidazole-4-carboxamide isomerase [Haloferax massiliensis]
MFPEFEVVPAVDMQDGEVVQLVQGERGTEKTYGDPVEAARRWVDAGAETLHLVDLDGAFEGERKNAPAVDAVLDAVDVPLQLGGGIRTADDARDLLDRGVDRVILGTAAVENPDIVAELADDYPDGVMVSLDAKDGEVVVSGWTEGTGLDPAEAAARYEDLGAAAILFTDVDVEGRLEGVHLETTSAVVDAVDIPVVASGGVASAPRSTRAGSRSKRRWRRSRVAHVPRAQRRSAARRYASRYAPTAATRLSTVPYTPTATNSAPIITVSGREVARNGPARTSMLTVTTSRFGLPVAPRRINRSPPNDSIPAVSGRPLPFQTPPPSTAAPTASVTSATPNATATPDRAVSRSPPTQMVYPTTSAPFRCIPHRTRPKP